MEYYEGGMECRLCGKNIILTATELMYHFRHCRGLEDLGITVADEGGVIRTYGERTPGFIVSVFTGGGGVGRGGVLLTDGDITLDDLVRSEAMRELFADVPEMRRRRKIQVDEYATDALLMPPLRAADTLGDIFKEVRMTAVQVKGMGLPIFIKKALTVRISQAEPLEPVMIACGQALNRDFFAVGYVLDQFCTDENSIRAAEFSDYASLLMKYGEPSMYIGIESLDDRMDTHVPPEIKNNYMTGSQMQRFRRFVRKMGSCDTCSAADVFGTFTIPELRGILRTYGVGSAGMKKDDMVRYLALGQHVERGITEKINAYEYDLLMDLMDCDGYCPVTGELDTSFIRLFRLGLVCCGHCAEHKLVLFIPREFLFLYKRLLSDRQVVEDYDRMVLLERRLNGFLYAYGILTPQRLWDVYEKTFGEPPFGDEGERSGFEIFRGYLREKYAFWSQKTSVGRLFESEDGEFIYHENYCFPTDIRPGLAAKELRKLTPEEVEEHGSREEEEYVAAYDNICVDILEMMNLGEDDMNTLYTYMYNLMLFCTKQGASPELVFDLLTRKLPIPFEIVKHVYDELKAEAPFQGIWRWGGYSGDELAKLAENDRPIIKMSFKNSEK